MTFSHLVLDEKLNTSSLIVNAKQSAQGNVGVMVALPAGEVLSVGTRRVARAFFIASGGIAPAATAIRFTDTVLRREVVDARANRVPMAEFLPANIAITGRSAAHVSAANYANQGFAAESLVSAFGTELAVNALGATQLPLPTTLGGTQVIVKDSLSVERPATLLYVSPIQVNYQLPADTALGTATVTITNLNGVTSSGIVQVTRVSPGVFSANSSGSGFAAAQVVRVRPDGTQLRTPVARYDSTLNQFVAIPIEMNSTDELFLEMYGTGMRARSSLAAVKVRIADLEYPVEYAGAQGAYAGLDQINLKLPQTLSGRGETVLEIIVDGNAANPVRVTLR